MGKIKTIIIILCAITLMGCHHDKIFVLKERSQNNNNKWKVLAPYIKKHWNLDKDLKEIAADLAYEELKMQLSTSSIGDISITPQSR